jgi:hypothetical protein
MEARWGTGRGWPRPWTRLASSLERTGSGKAPVEEKLGSRDGKGDAVVYA